MKENEPAKWTGLVGDDQWLVYKKAIDVARGAKVPFVVGGAFGLAAYTGRWRNTKDLDFFVTPDHKDRFIAALLKAGFKDYYEQLAYDRSWIFRLIMDETLVDVIWTTPNHRTIVTEDWIDNCGWLAIRDERLGVIPPEELISIKLYVMQRDRCDWPDVINLINAAGEKMDWERLIEMMGPDLPLLKAALSICVWLNPASFETLPEAAKRLVPGILEKENGETERERVALLDSRKWYAAFVPETELMQL